MMQVLSIPNAGRMPALAELPTALWLPVVRLAQLNCVDYVVADAVLSNTTLVVMVLFTGVPDYRKALDCFRGLKPCRVRVNGECQSLVITLRAFARA